MTTTRVPFKSKVATSSTTVGISAGEMAELHADSPNKLSEEPMVMATKTKVTQPLKTDTTSASLDSNDTGLQVTCGVESTANEADSASQFGSEANEPVDTSVLAVEGPSIDDPAAAAAAAERIDTQIQIEPKKKKKKSKKLPKSRRGITGFEEYYADPPMTPAEAVEKERLYEPSRPFSDRIEECIQRFRVRRRLDTQRTTMFNKYLFLGGIDSSQRQFTGMANDKDAMAEADTEQIRTMTAVDYVGGNGSRFYDRNNPDDWEVDFEAVAKGFLSRTITDWYMYDEEAIKLAADLIKNFLNYVLMHDVCPEYIGNVVAARNVCDIAVTEFRHMHELILELPGTFNCTIHSLFCERRVEHLDDQSNYEALIRFRLTTLLCPSSGKMNEIKEQVIEAEDPTTIKVTSMTEETYQVLRIERPPHKDKTTMNEQLAMVNMNEKIKLAGFIHVVPTIIAHGWGNMPRPEEVDFSDATEKFFVLEDELLTKFHVGMKVRMMVCELNIGLHFIKEVYDVRVSFDTFLPQYLMTNWKDPVPNERPPPSIHDPGAEERDLNADMED
ncbi:hypothetical protein ONZ43_g2874 [Nemania bipapillata]|uniref:Uncharacterized protein n=1 Tax=Nemania bipapillata TaxID=110536 RepID=A0ACC2IYY4_9PEZI|nr:hypothetical protein ONZ43_g2874 [Nemania bipapillata]